MIRRLVPLAAALIASTCTAAELPPVAAFTSQAKVALVSISPTGEYLAATIRDGDNSAFQVITHPKREVKVNFPLGDRREIARIWWVADDMLLVAPARRGQGSEFLGRTLELMTIHAETGKTERVGFGTVLDTLPDDAEHILISRTQDRFGEAHRLNLKSRSSRRVARSAAPYGGFVPDASGDVLFSIGENQDNMVEVHYRAKRGDDWALVESHGIGERGWQPAWFGPKPNTYFTWDSRGGATTGIGLYDAVAGTHKMLVRHDQVDATRLLYDFAERRVYGVRFDHHYPAFTYIDRGHPLAAQHAALAKMYPEDTVEFTSFTRDHQQAVALVSGDRRPGDYLLVDTAAKSITPLMSRRPALESDMLSPMAPAEFNVRDGSKVYGYLTSPKDGPTPGPMLVYVHGGPHGVRDYWGFDPIVQLFASRGYHVLQVNYRGSGGYGVDYEKSGYSEWGRQIEEDVADAVRWAIKSGIAAPDRVCVHGVSYGAYSALMGAVREPELYRCAIASAGIYDLTLLEKAGDIRRRRAGLRYIRDVVGDDDAELESRSPAHLAERIRAKVMLIHGGQDVRSPPPHAHAMRAALRSAGNEPEWLFDGGQGHGFRGNEPRRELYTRILAFLAEHTAES